MYIYYFLQWVNSNYIATTVTSRISYKHRYSTSYLYYLCHQLWLFRTSFPAPGPHSEVLATYTQKALMLYFTVLDFVRRDFVAEWWVSRANRTHGSVATWIQLENGRRYRKDDGYITNARSLNTHQLTTLAYHPDPLFPPESNWGGIRKCLFYPLLSFPYQLYSFIL